MNYEIIEYKKIKPFIDESTFIANGSVVIGDVVIGKNSSIWFNAVLRGDVNYIRVGDNTNIQDGSVVHTSRHDGPTIIGNDITIGHMALIHACIIKDHAFIGMGAKIIDRAIVEEYAFVGAGSLVTGGKIVKSRELWTGVPAKFVRLLGDKDISEMKANAEHYVKLAKIYQTQ